MAYIIMISKHNPMTRKRKQSRMYYMSNTYISALHQSERGDSRECAEWCRAALSGSPAKDFTSTRERQHKMQGERQNTSDESRKFQHNKEKNVG